jgi:arylsulfatase A-like enzyme
VRATYRWLDGANETLAETLSARGWDTWAFSANPYVTKDTNLVQGFDTFASSMEAPWKKEAKRVTRDKMIPRDKSSDMSLGWEGKRTIGEAHRYKDAGPVAHEALLKWLDERPGQDKPWFAFVNMMEAHIPRLPSLESREALLDPDTLERGLATAVSQIDLLAFTFGRKEYTPEELHAVQGVYDAAVRDLDVATEALIEDLRHRGLLEDTIVVLTADHGENLGDHHMFGHKFALWDTLLHVPLVIRAPGRMAPGRVATPVSNLAVYATILDLLGVDPPAPGPDLTTSLAGVVAPSAIVSELLESTPVSIARIDKEYGLFDKSWWLRKLQAVEEDGWKLVVADDGTHELFHVAEDPTESTDLAAQDPARVAELRGALEGWNARTPDYDPSRRTGKDHPPKIDHRAKSMLATLGYLDQDEPGTDPEFEEPEPGSED